MTELTAVERRLVDAVTTGAELDLADGAPVTVDDLAGWGADREVRAEVVRDLLLGRLGGAPDPRGLRIRGARLVGPVALGGVQSDIPLILRHCDVPEEVNVRGARFPLLSLDGCRIDRITGDNLRVEGPLLLRHGLRVANGVRLVNARIAGVLDLSGAQLRNPDGPAFNGNQLRVDGPLDLGAGFVAEGRGAGGAVRLPDAVLGILKARGARVTNPDGPALRAERLDAGGAISLTQGCELHGVHEDGAVQLAGAKVGGFISLDGARITNTAGAGFSAPYLDVTGSVYIDGGMTCEGSVRLSGGRIGGKLQLDGVTITTDERPALDLARLEVGQALIVRRAELTVRNGNSPALYAGGVKVGGQLSFTDVRAGGPGPYQFSGFGAVISGPAFLSGLTVAGGGLDLRNFTVGQLIDDPGTGLPPDARLRLDGMSYIGLPGGLPHRPDLARRLAWLRRMDRYAPQPYRQLAAAYQQAGYEDEARKVLIAQQRHLRDAGLLIGASRLRHRLLGLTLGYGYQSWRALVGLFTVLALAVLLFTGVPTATAAGPGRACPVTERIGLAIDVTVPLVESGRGRCDLDTSGGAGQALLAASWGLQLGGWAFATLLVAGYTGLVRRS